MGKQRQYVATLNTKRIPLGTGAALDDLLAQVGGEPFVDLLVEEVRGKMRGWERMLYSMLGLSTTTDVPCFILLRAGEEFMLTFLDSAWSESRASDPERRGRDERTTFKLGEGGTEVAALAECLSREKALEAIRYYFEHRKRPPWLSYERVA